MIDILIPTYSRSDCVKKNILLLNEQLSKSGLLESFRILVSDNCSEDNTWNTLKSLKNNIEVELEVYRQKENIGLEPNAIFLLERARNDYVMYLGDDDYLPSGYLSTVVELIQNNGANCIIPGFSALYPDGTIRPARDAPFDIKRYEPGFLSVCEISSYGHQMSGLVTRRERLYEEYLKIPDNRNIYPFIFFVTYSVFYGVSYYVPKFKVLVSQGNSKDWSYDDSGLLLEVFKNYRTMFSEDERSFNRACLSFVEAQPLRLAIGKNPWRSIKPTLHLLGSDELSSRFKMELMFLLYRIYFAKLSRFFKRKMFKR